MPRHSPGTRHPGDTLRGYKVGKNARWIVICTLTARHFLVMSTAQMSSRVVNAENMGWPRSRIGYNLAATYGPAEELWRQSQILAGFGPGVVNRR